MIKYHKEIEEVNDFTLPLVKTYRTSILSLRDNYKIVKNVKIPTSFFKKYNKLFIIITQINELLKMGEDS